MRYSRIRQRSIKDFNYYIMLMYDFSRILFLMENKKSFVIQGILVKFDESLLHSYSKVIEHLKKVVRSFVGLFR